MTADQIAKKLKEIRKEKGLDSKELSLKLNKEEDYIQKIEEGELLPTRNELSQICLMLNTTLDLLFDEENDKEALLHDIHNELKKYDVEELLRFYYMIKK